MSRPRRRAWALLLGAPLALFLITSHGSSPRLTTAPDEVGERICAGYAKAVGPTRRPVEAFSAHAGVHSGARLREWDDFMARVGVELYGALVAETEALEQLPPLQRAERSWAPSVSEAITTDRKLVEALSSASSLLSVDLVLLQYEFRRDTADRNCGYLERDNNAAREGLRVCQHSRTRNLQDWWTMRCGWYRR